MLFILEQWAKIQRKVQFTKKKYSTDSEFLSKDQINMESESELVFISDVEFANTVQELKILKRFHGQQVTNKFEIVSKEVLGSKYEHAYLDFEKCDPVERRNLRNNYVRIEKTFQKNSRRGNDLSFGLDGSNTFISSEMYPTMVVSPPPPPRPGPR